MAPVTDSGSEVDVLNESALSEQDEFDAAAQALGLFDQVVAATPGFRQRAGQRAMAERIASAMQVADLGASSDPRRAIAVIQAGTGVGKSAAYLATMVALAVARKTRVVVSTATVALQEQLLNKDLPALAAVLPEPLTFALAKGRARYVCRLKLERLVSADATAGDLFEPDDDAPEPHLTGRIPSAGASAARESLAQRQHQYRVLADLLASGQWDGDRDTLAQPPEPADWAPLAAQRHTCTGRHCPLFRDCSYFQARKTLAQAQVIVANHDLVLASLGHHALPELDQCLLVFDEGHHLPAVALDQFSASMSLTALRWLERLPRVLRDVAASMDVPLTHDVPALAAQLQAALQDIARLMLDALRQNGSGLDAIWRLPQGVLPADWHEPMAQIQSLAQTLTQELEALGAELKQRARDDPSQAPANAVQYARLGGLAPRLQGVLGTSTLLLTQSETPLAKWVRASTGSGLVALSAHACPIEPGDLLRTQLWSQVRAAVVTSASLASCGSFDYFLHETGLQDAQGVTTLLVDSPFDYARQGTLTVYETRADPRQVDPYTCEMIAALLDDLRQVTHGALVLFTSRVQMKAAVQALDSALRERVLVQGELSRNRLLGSHTLRIESGLPSVIFGMQSFGEGLDLPGALCETVFIAKLPFASPADPVEEARAEWLQRQGRDAFSERVVPATGLRLLQWTGRAIRSETDVAQVVCYDRRLLATGYGRRMLRGLPPYVVLRRAVGQRQTAPG